MGYGNGEEEDWSRGSFSHWKHKNYINFDPAHITKSHQCLWDLYTAAAAFLKKFRQHRNSREEFWGWLEARERERLSG